MSSEYSAGARYERKAMREYLNRVLRAENKKRFPNGYRRELLCNALRWVKTRQKRYDQRAGGL